MTDIKKQADGILGEIKTVTEKMITIETEADRAIAELTEGYAARLLPLRAGLKQKEKEIVSLMKAGKAGIFGGKDMLRLINGVLFHASEEKVTIPRGTLAKVEELGFDEAIKIAKSLDRSIINAWPDEKLEMIGTRREMVETFDYEVK